MSSRQAEQKSQLARESQTNLNVLLRSNIEGLLRQMTHDHVVPKIAPSTLHRYKKPTPWHRLLAVTASQPKQRARMESLIREITGDKDWHVQGPETGYPPASLARLAEKADIPERRLRQIMYPEGAEDSLGNQLTLAEALRLCAATNISLQQLLTPPWWAIATIEFADLSEVEYLGAGRSVPTDRWVSWLYSIEPLPFQDEFLFERNMSHPPPLGPRFDEDGRRVHKNRGVDFHDVNEMDRESLFSEKSWRAELNSLTLFEAIRPSEQSSTSPDPVRFQRHLSAAFWISGLFVQIRRLLRASRKRGTSKKLDSFWEVTSKNVAHLLGRLARLRRQQSG